MKLGAGRLRNVDKSTSFPLYFQLSPFGFQLSHFNYKVNFNKPDQQYANTSSALVYLKLVKLHQNSSPASSHLG